MASLLQSRILKNLPIVLFDIPEITSFITVKASIVDCRRILQVCFGEAIVF